LRTRLKRVLFEGEVLRLMGFTMIVKPIGLVTQMLTASYFGAGAQYDAYALAFFFVTFLDNMIGQAYNSVVVPLTIRLRGELGERQLLRFQNAVLGIFLIPVVGFMALLMLRGRWVVHLVAPNLPAETAGYVANMLHWMALPGVAMMAISMGNAVLNANRRFWMAGAMPIVNAVIFLVAIIVLRRPLGIWALPAAFMSSTLVQFIAIISFTFSTRCIAPVRPAVPPGRLDQLWSLGGVFLLSQFVLMIGVFVEKYFATGLEAGSVSAIAYATTILNMGGSLFSASLTVVMFTRMSEYFAEGRIAEGSSYILDNLRRQTRIVVPASLALCLASHEIVRVLFARGAFDAHATALTGSALAIYVLGLPGMLATTLVARIYHSLQRMRDRLWQNAQFVATGVVCSILLVKSHGVVGLAWAATIAYNTHLALSLWMLHRYRTGLDVGSFWRVLARAHVLASATWLLYLVTGFARMVDKLPFRDSTLGALLCGALRCAFVMGVYFAGYRAWALRDRRRAATSAVTPGGGA
jgi:putative peptidoglycan lipid II flippase